MVSPVIAVGVDGSPASAAALRWAAAEAVRRHEELIAIHAYDWRALGARAANASPGYADEAREHAQAVVDAAIAEARAAQSEVKVRGEVVEGHPSAALLSAAENSSLVVVGSRGRGGFASLLLGSVSQQVAMHAHGPVVVVRGRPEAAAGPIVVGMDGSPAAQRALGAAFGEAELRGAAVVAVRVYPRAHPAWAPDLPVELEDPVQRRENEQRFLLEDVDPWRERYPDVSVECVVVEGHAGEVLVGLSAGAELIVVGSRGRAGFRALGLGSVGLQLLHHSESPVLVVPVAA